ncbi:hypothetical protein M404DRAFT_24995 [Pisolithus tinctorius Marx 270]|uniref:CCHC-type domain-containing protein n=1 Tax=Pisolithus tinctorius Marx 270 TaxID=870435 RepID=A0A0C3K9G4_PISTI|nr:hypothetical protein M404DRAFT_24995 [Pisolithus tinctorius Marx 270]
MSSLGQYYRNFRRISLSLENLLGPLPHLASMFKYGFPPEFRREVLKHHDTSEYSVLSLMSTAKEVLRSSGGLWKSSKVNSSRAQPSRASDSRSPRHSYSFCFFCGLSGHIRAGCYSFKSYLASGKCLLVNGRVVLPTGLEILREVAGRTLRDRLDNWSSLTSQFKAHTGPSPARSLSPTAAPSRSVFDTPSRVPAQTSIMHTQSLPTIQLEPVVPDPPAIRHSRGGHVAEADRPRVVVHTRARRLERLTLFFLVVVVLALTLSFTFEEGVFIHPFQTEAVVQLQSHAPALSKSALTLRVARIPLCCLLLLLLMDLTVSSMDLPTSLEFPMERHLASHPAPSHTLHDASHPQIQFRQGTLSTWPLLTPLVARQDKCYLPHTERISRSLLRRSSRFLASPYYSTPALCRSILRVLWSYLARFRVAPLAFWEDCSPRQMLHVDIRVVLIGAVVPEIFAFLCEGPSSRSYRSSSHSSAPFLSLFWQSVPLAETSLGTLLGIGWSDRCASSFSVIAKESPTASLTFVSIAPAVAVREVHLSLPSRSRGRISGASAPFLSLFGSFIPLAEPFPGAPSSSSSAPPLRRYTPFCP